MENSNKVTRRRIYSREEVCVGCRLCEIYCIAAHSEYKNDLIKTFKKISKRRPLPGIIVEERKPISFGLQCRHCEEPECVKACITGAMQKNPETGVVTNDAARCIGCWTCILACPYGVIRRDYRERKIASKCDFCMENGGEPVCVKNCPNEALYIGNVVEESNMVEESNRGFREMEGRA
ncbi:MAG: 4Fe-4S dicluster domain-containing protein [Firmicutes bacterium]|nr:4Fe-4S dicluster domain-containing protein [Bacillota bacterium]